MNQFVRPVFWQCLKRCKNRLRVQCNGLAQATGARVNGTESSTSVNGIYYNLAGWLTLYSQNKQTNKQTTTTKQNKQTNKQNKKETTNKQTNKQNQKTNRITNKQTKPKHNQNKQTNKKQQQTKQKTKTKPKTTTTKQKQKKSLSMPFFKLNYDDSLVSLKSIRESLGKIPQTLHFHKKNKILLIRNVESTCSHYD